MRDRSESGVGEPAGTRANKRADQAKAFIQAARGQAAEILAEAEAKKDALIQEANAQGMQEGQAQAEHMRQQLEGLEQRMRKEVNAEAIRTAVQIAQRLVEHGIESRHETAVDIAVAALKQTSDAREVFLRAHPSTVAILLENKQRLLDTLSMAKDVNIRADRNVPVGGVLIQTESGVIDATLETQLSELGRVLGA